MRVHELAKELGIPSKELVEKLKALHVDVKSHMSTVDEATAQSVREGVCPSPTPAASAPAPAPVTVAAPAPTQPAATQPDAAVAPAPEARAATAVGGREAADAGQGDRTAGLPKVIRMKGAIMVKDLAAKLGVRPPLVIKELMRMNILATINERVDINVAKKIAVRYGVELLQDKRLDEHRQSLRKPTAEEELVRDDEDREEDLLPRPPVVTFLGHVDHGKTSLMDRIRNTSVAAGESGGITQHIGAYTVEAAGKRITFLDTPGHAAFTAMRARGANLTDIAVIIIAADDGIMPQTREAIQHAQAAQVSIMVAINKCDLPAARPDRVRQQLQAEGLAPEDWGGETIVCEVSAITGAGVDHLLEMLLLQAEILELRANPRRRARGYVIEAQLEPGKGPTATLLVTAGTLAVGDAILCGSFCGRVRALINDHGSTVKSAGPATPVKCMGLNGVPDAGAQFLVCKNERDARNLAAEQAAKLREDQITPKRRASLESLYDQLASSDRLELKVILKADTQGSVEAISHSLAEIRSDKISLNIILSGTGSITVNDVMLASASNAIILGFHVVKEPGVDAACRREGVQIRLHEIIYEMLDQVRDAMTGLLAPQVREIIQGHATIRQVFPHGKLGKIAGCMVTDGIGTARSRIRLLRNNEELYVGSVASLRHFKDQVAEVRAGSECGIQLLKFVDIQDGDVLEFFQLEETRQSL